MQRSALSDASSVSVSSHYSSSWGLVNELGVWGKNSPDFPFGVKNQSLSVLVSSVALNKALSHWEPLSVKPGD